MPWLEGFRNKVVLVTGASSGIGEATARAFASAGARVALAARRRERLEEVARLAAADGGETLVLPTDVTRREDVRACFAATVARFGRLDVVVNNAGILIPSPVTGIVAADLEAMLRVNLFGALFVMQEAVPLMRRQRAGSIVTVASLAGRRGFTPLGGYCATKFGLVGLTEALRLELHDDPVHVGLVLPGVVETPMVERATQDQEFRDLWPQSLNMPPSWVVWAILASARFHLREVSVPPGTATLEKLAALAPGVADTLVHWAKSTSHWLATVLASERASAAPAPRQPGTLRDVA
jgi:NAD(P)-dependent dehydrogenase (short-subunit alcohol dehydrogenase family)